MRRINCPYHWCSRVVEVVPAPRYPGTHRTDSELITAHVIAHPVLPGTCPASNMHYPLDEESAQHLRDQEQADGRRIPKLVTGSVPEGSRPRRAWDRPRPARDDDSRSLRQPSRVGREPEPGSQDWALGGREDEESGKTKPPIKPPRTPRGVAGQEVGRHVASVDELIGMAQQIALVTGEAIGSLNEARDALDIASAKVEEGLSELAALQGQATSETLGAYHQILTQAGTDIRALMEQAEEIASAIGAGHEKGEEFIGRLLS